jgi:hypothetical protein
MSHSVRRPTWKCAISTSDHTAANVGHAPHAAAQQHVMYSYVTYSHASFRVAMRVLGIQVAHTAMACRSSHSPCEWVLHMCDGASITGMTHSLEHIRHGVALATTNPIVSGSHICSTQKLVAHAKPLHPGVPSFEGEFARFFQN